MAHKKAAGSAKNLRDSNPKYRGVKIYRGQLASHGAIIIRQKGDKYKAGKNVYVAKDFTLHAGVEGIVTFRKKKVKRYDGRKYIKTFVDILPMGEAAEKKAPAKSPPAKKAATKKPVAKPPVAKKLATPASQDISSLTVKELKAKAKDLGISGYSTMKKDELVAIIQKA